MNTTTKKANVSQNKADCINRVHSYINEIAPKLIEELKKGYRLNNDGQLFKKDKDRLKAIIESKKHFRAVVACGYNSIALWCDDNYITQYYSEGGHGCAYYKKTVYLWDTATNEPTDFKPLELTSSDEIANLEKELEALKDEKYDIENKINSIKYKLGV